jgi:hypothetical protein
MKGGQISSWFLLTKESRSLIFAATFFQLFNVRTACHFRSLPIPHHFFNKWSVYRSFLDFQKFNQDSEAVGKLENRPFYGFLWLVSC